MTTPLRLVQSNLLSLRCMARRLTRGAPRLVDGVFGGWLIVASSAAAQEVIRDFHGQPTPTYGNDQFGLSTAVIGDVDGDGVVDLVVGCPNEDRAKAGRADGVVYVISGATGVEIRSHVGTRFEQLGMKVAAGSDLDGDGVGEYVATPDLMRNQIVYAWSGATGALLYSIAPSSGEAFNTIQPVICLLQDLDGDGGGEIGIGGITITGSSWVGKLFVYAGRTGARLFEYLSPSATGPGGGVFSACRLGDLNGDSIEEFGVAYSYNGDYFDIVDGAFHVYLASVTGDIGTGDFGSSCGRLGDVDRDGIEDFVVADDQFSGVIGRIYVFSGATFQRLFTIDSPDPNAGPYFGLVPADGRFDFDGDGWADIASGVGDWLFQPPGFQYTFASVFSGKTGRLLYEWKAADHPVTGDELLGWSVAVADVNGDGFGDLLAGAPMNGTVPKSGGVVHAFSGNDLLLQANDDEYAAGRSIDLWTRGGEPGGLTLLAVTDIDGTPTFDELALTTLDSFGESTLSDIVPSGLAGMTFTLEAYATRPLRRGLEISSKLVLRFQ